MCEAVVLGVNPIGAVLTNPLNVSMTSIVWAVVFRITVACPVPGEAAGGTSSAPVRLAVKVIMSALLADTGRSSTDANASRHDRIELLGSDSFMFASPLKKRHITLWKQV